MSPTSTTVFPPATYPTSLTPRPDDRRPSPASIFEQQQRETLPINVPLPTTSKEPVNGTEHQAPEATSLSPRTYNVSDADLIDGMEDLGSPASFHTAMDIVSPTFGNLGLAAPSSPGPVTPKTSTSILSFMSDMSTLGPLVTHQDIKDNEEWEDKHRTAQRKKLENMLGNGVVVGIDAGSREMKARCLAETKADEPDMDGWEVIPDNGNTSKSKLERTLGQGADSAHVALNAEYRKRPGDSLDLGRTSQEGTTESSIVPLLKAIPAALKAMCDGQSTSTTTLAKPSFPTTSSDTSVKLVGSGSFSAVLQAGRKRLQSRDQDSATSRRGRSSSPDSPDSLDVSQFEGEERGRITDDELKVVNDLDPAERKILLKRTRKLERVLGETLKEREVGRHVVQCHAEKCAISDAEEREGEHRYRASFDATSQPTSDRSQSEVGLPSLSLESTCPMDMSPPNTAANDRDSSDARLRNDSNLEVATKVYHAPQGSPSPRSIKTRARRYSSPTSPGNGAWHDDDDTLGDLASPGYFAHGRSSVERDRRQRRLQMIKLFGEIPPPNRYLADVGSPSHTSASPANRRRSNRSALRAHVDSYYQSIQFIRYLLENDRQSLEHVIGDIQEDAVPVDEIQEEADDDVASAAEQEVGEAYGLQRQRSLSTPCVSAGLPSDRRSSATPNTSPQATGNLDFDSLTSLRRRAAKLNSFFGDPRIGSGHIGRQSKQYIITDKKVALEKLLLELEDNANFDAEQGDLEEEELSEIRSQLLSVRRSVLLLIGAPDASITDAP
ncbi:hypothetical protein QFC22_004400 [Naganishia vaughanmartiniae]|uniref:Uncharacterized protein n=1 Tax=Naganishia vaughanmartiniae TaxID=1424756 RepID=A0ACC2X0I2_9TREE|nr:hypothetical protein QFC22_004400 [Naganishia vaughanmartiniae]